VGNIDLAYEAVGHSHFALEALRVLGTNGIFVLTGVPGLQAFIEADPASLMRDMVLKNQVLLGTVNAGTDAFASALRNLDLFRRRWPEAVQTLIAGRHPPRAGGRADPGQTGRHQDRDRVRRPAGITGDRLTVSQAP
jgi:threonine dehydrogenase-like Zn-dependent dehydrogenase